MRRISDRTLIDRAIGELELNLEFDTESLKFEMRLYEKGEQMVSPLSPLKQFVFIVSGNVRIYQLKENSAICSLKVLHKREYMGNNEFCFGNGEYTLYAEALTRTRCLILPFEQPARDLKSDSRFLLFLLRNSLMDHIQDSEITHFHSDLEDRLLFYMEKLCRDRTMTSVNHATAVLNCSRRQLQRVLKKLCGEKKLVHCGRGCYKIAEDAPERF